MGSVLPGIPQSPALEADTGAVRDLSIRCAREGSEMLVEMVPLTMRRSLNIHLAGTVISGRDAQFLSFLEGKPCVLRFIFALVIGFVTSLNSVTAASAQTYPQRTVKFILPFGPAAGVDITARLLGEKLAARWGKPVVIENRPGGDGLVAINAFASANDDHTLLFVPASTFTAHPYAHEKLPYDAERDLLPITAARPL